MVLTLTRTNANASNDKSAGRDYVVVDANDVVASLDSALAMLERIARGESYTASDYFDNVRAIQQTRNDFVAAFGARSVTPEQSLRDCA